MISRFLNLDSFNTSFPFAKSKWVHDSHTNTFGKKFPVPLNDNVNLVWNRMVEWLDYWWEPRLRHAGDGPFQWKKYIFLHLDSVRWLINSELDCIFSIQLCRLRVAVNLKALPSFPIRHRPASPAARFMMVELLMLILALSEWRLGGQLKWWTSSLWKRWIKDGCDSLNDNQSADVALVF